MTDAIVIGAGLSGLVCARRLVEAGREVVVVEARDRVGGRLHTGRVGGALVDLGGQWMTAGQPRLAALARELGVATERHERSGRALVDDRGGIVAAFAQWRAMRRIEALMKSRDAGFDTWSLADWFVGIRNPIARERIALHADLIFATDPANLSFLAYLATMHATGGFRPAESTEDRFEGGAQALALRIAERLGDRVRLAEPAMRVDDDGTVATTRGTYRARRVVLAIPPVLAREVTIALAPMARRYAEAAFAGPVVKVFAAYERAFWRDAGWSGELYQPTGTVRATVELGGDPPVLLAFVVGREAARWGSRDPAERRADVLATFARFGDARPIDYLEVDWGADPWSAGCVPGLPPGVLTAGARWREGHGVLHIAGTESATRWPGYMEGAIDAGERAADEVLAALA